jgi:hypothetical protein
MCIVYKAARGDEKAFKWMVDALDYNSTQLAYIQFPCKCKPPCPWPTDRQMRVFNDRLNKVLRRMRVTRDVVLKIGSSADLRRQKVLDQVSQRLGHKVTDLIAKKSTGDLTDPKSVFSRLADRDIAWLQLKTAMLPERSIGDFSKRVFPVIKNMPVAALSLEEIMRSQPQDDRLLFRRLRKLLRHVRPRRPR